MSWYGRRPSYVTASWNRRIYPASDPDAQYDASQTMEALSRVRTSRSARQATTVEEPTNDSRPQTDSVLPAVAAAQNDAPPDRPPPVYFRGDSRLQRGTSELVGMGSSTTAAQSQRTTVQWEQHIAYEESWIRFLRIARWYRAARRERERLSDAWPKDFSGASRPSHDGQISIASHPDSGIGMMPYAASEAYAVLGPVFKERIQHLNEIIPAQLVDTRLWLAATEVLNLAWLIVLIIALGTNHGNGGFVKGAAIAFVMIIIVDGVVVNAVRMRRWTLLRQLRLLSRDWSPLPITSSTNQGLVQNYLGEEEATVVHQPAPPPTKDEPTMRWSMTRTEGGWWISWRPMIRLELITPPSVTNPIVPQFDAPPPVHDFPEEAPAYTQ